MQAALRNQVNLALRRFLTIMAISRQKEARSLYYDLLLSNEFNGCYATLTCISANTRQSANAVFMLAHRSRRWPNISPTASVDDVVCLIAVFGVLRKHQKLTQCRFNVGPAFDMWEQLCKVISAKGVSITSSYSWASIFNVKPSLTIGR